MKIILVLFLVLRTRAGYCPQECVCELDDSGRRSVVCFRGGLADPIPVASLDENVEVFRIWAPPEAPNSLTIGPIFQRLSRLEELHIVRSNVPSLGKRSFWGLHSLRVLNLTYNNISHVVEPSFKGLNNLLKLHLDGNRIESMPSESFRHLENLKVLTLTNNEIRQLVPRIFLNLRKLEKLDLSGNPLFELNPEVFKDVRRLKVFKCRSCRLSMTNSIMYRLLVHLEELDLGNNALRQVLPEPPGFFPRQLQVLRLDGNSIRALGDGELANDDGGPCDLRLLDLSGNRLADMGVRPFANVTTLRALYLRRNLLTHLEPETWLPVADSLRHLDLGGNPIPMSDLKSVIELASKLTDLSLSDMNLKDLPLGLLVHNQNLKFFNLSGNRFSHISPQVVHLMSRVDTLDLSRNRFRGVPEKVLSRLEKIPNLVLADNPWACDLCHIPPLLNRANGSRMRTALEGLACASPPPLRGRPVAGLRGGDLKWCAVTDAVLDGFEGLPPVLTAAAAVLAAVLLFLAALGSCVAYVRRRRRSAHYYTREGGAGAGRVSCGLTAMDATFVGFGTNGKAVLKASKPLENVSIAVIDEFGKHPELQVLTNGT